MCGLLRHAVEHLPLWWQGGRRVRFLPVGRTVVVSLLVLIVACVVAAAGLLGEMFRRDEPILGVLALGTLLATALLSAVYTALDAG